MSVRRVLTVISLLLILALLAVPPALESSHAPAPAAPAGDATATSKPLAAGAASTEKESKSSLEKYEARLKTWFSILGLWIAAILAAAGVVLIAILIWKRRKASLTIEAFGDSAVDAKVGSVVSGLVQKRLSDLSARGRQGKEAYKLDVIVADVELLAADGNLESALAGLADASQFKLAVALLGLVDRMVGRHLVAKGELAPPGEMGCGVVLSLQTQAKGIGSSGSLWGDGTKRKQASDSTKPGPYYALAERSAAWIQYEAARSLKAKNVDLITKSARSFSRLSEGLAQQRLNEIEAAMALYVDAIEEDPENVAALFNLSVILARDYGRYDWAIGLLKLARLALFKRYREAEAR